jgi:hypothetical protein
MPVLAVMAHLALIDTDGLAAIVAVLGEHVVEAAETVRLALSHDVALAAELLIAVEACKVLHVPRTTLGLGALIGQDNLDRAREMEKIC